MNQATIALKIQSCECSSVTEPKTFGLWQVPVVDVKQQSGSETNGRRHLTAVIVDLLDGGDFLIKRKIKIYH